jgi:ElaB/YqjD/DUF883 family membrane-anchored ribosome-binding protein
MPDTNVYPSSTPAGTADAQGVTDKISDLASQARDKAADLASQARDKASDLGRSAVRKVDESRSSAASALQSTAETLRSNAPAGGRIGEMAQSAAATLKSTANYVQQTDVRGMMGDLEQVVRRNPGPALIAAAAFGFLLGSALRRDRD